MEPFLVLSQNQGGVVAVNFRHVYKVEPNTYGASVYLAVDLGDRYEVLHVNESVPDILARLVALVSTADAARAIYGRLEVRA